MNEKEPVVIGRMVFKPSIRDCRYLRGEKTHRLARHFNVYRQTGLALDSVSIGSVQVSAQGMHYAFHPACSIALFQMGADDVYSLYEFLKRANEGEFDVSCKEEKGQTADV